MKREDCLNANIDRMTFDIISGAFGIKAAEDLDPLTIEDIRVQGFRRMSEAVKEIGPVEGLFEESIKYEYFRRRRT